MEDKDIIDLNPQERIDMFQNLKNNNKDMVLIDEEMCFIVLGKDNIVIESTDHYMVGPEWKRITIDEEIKDLKEEIEDNKDD